jgi:hypothetical protein
MESETAGTNSDPPHPVWPRVWRRQQWPESRRKTGAHLTTMMMSGILAGILSEGEQLSCEGGESVSAPIGDAQHQFIIRRGGNASLGEAPEEAMALSRCPAWDNLTSVADSSGHFGRQHSGDRAKLSVWQFSTTVERQEDQRQMEQPGRYDSCRLNKAVEECGANFQADGHVE